MRNRLTFSTAALVLASATLAWAQTSAPASPTQAPLPASPVLGTIDFGGAFGDTSGDTARYERYRDTRNGVFSDINFSREGATYFTEFKANHIGYRDQRLEFGFDGRKGSFSFLFDSIPTNYYYDALTPFLRGSTTLTLDDNAQRNVQTKVAVGVPCAPGAPPAACGNPTQAAQALANRSIYNTLASEFDLQSKRQTLGFGGNIDFTRNLAATLRFASTAKTGEQPWGASFAFNNADELPLPLDHRTNDFNAGLEFNGARGMLRVGWDGSWFNNNNDVLTWDNPLFLTNFSNGLAPPNGPWDPSGYSNGNGPAQGREAIWPSNTMNVISTTGLWKLARATAVNGTLQFMNQEQNEALIPWTTNALILQPATYAFFPELAELPRETAEAKATGLNALLNFTSRPFRNLGFAAKYRYNKRDVQTPHFDAVEYVRFDAVPEETGGETEQFDVTRQNFDANATASLLGYGSFKLGYGHETYEREGRGFSDTGENVFRLSYDAMGLSFLSVRLGFDYGRRRGDGFVLSGLDYDTGPGGTQAGLRYYDEADRNRTRASVVLSANPMDKASIYFQYSHGKDEYLSDPSVPQGREQFGLIDQDYNSWNVGTTVNPSEKVAIGVNFGQDKFGAFQTSRNANPDCRTSPPCPASGYNSWLDPNRDWSLDNNEDVNNVSIWLDLARVNERVDLKFMYDLSDSDNALAHGGPRIQELNTNTPLTAGDTPPCAAGVTDCFTALPSVTNKWQRFTADAKFFFTKNVGAGIGYYYEKFDVTDFATIDANGSVPFAGATGTPRLDYLGELLTGYGNRPYSGSNFFIRLLYRF